MSWVMGHGHSFAPARRLRFVVNPQNFRSLRVSSLYTSRRSTFPTESLLTIYLSSQHEVVSIRTKLSHRRILTSTLFRHESRPTLRLFASSIYGMCCIGFAPMSRIEICVIENEFLFPIVLLSPPFLFFVSFHLSFYFVLSFYTAFHSFSQSLTTPLLSFHRLLS